MICLIDKQLLSNPTTSDNWIICKLCSLIINTDLDFLRVELHNYSSPIIFQILRFYLEQIYENRPLLKFSDIRLTLEPYLQYQKLGQVPESIKVRLQLYLDDMKQESRIILGTIAIELESISGPLRDISYEILLPPRPRE
ncbi:hypothetical protein BGZ58_008520 [Dissophora ornata]|nr:hypothetical protein BGZ58_008520 [Dissophora ornata]